MFDTPYVSVSAVLVDAIIYTQQRNGVGDRPPNRMRTGVVPKQEAITFLCSSHAPPALAFGLRSGVRKLATLISRDTLPWNV